MHPLTHHTHTLTHHTHPPTHHTPPTHIPVVDDPHGLEGLGFGWKGLKEVDEVAVVPPPTAPKEDDPQGLLLPH